MHNKTKNNVEIHLKTKEGITSSSRYHETKPTETKVDKMKEASIRTTEDKYSKQTNFGTIYVNGQEVFTTIDSCSSITVVHHGITLKSSKAEYEKTNDNSQDYKMLLKNLPETGMDTVMKNDMNNVDNHLPKKHKAVTDHLHFPFGNNETSQCDSHMKNGNNTRQVMEVVEKLNNRVGYGCRTSAWYIVYNNHLQLPANDKLQEDYYMGSEYDISQSMNEDIVHIRDNDREQFADDPRKGACTFDNNQSYSGSNISCGE